MQLHARAEGEDAPLRDQRRGVLADHEHKGARGQGDADGHLRGERRLSVLGEGERGSGAAEAMRGGGEARGQDGHRPRVRVARQDEQAAFTEGRGRFGVACAQCVFVPVRRDIPSQGADRQDAGCADGEARQGLLRRGRIRGRVPGVRELRLHLRDRRHTGASPRREGSERLPHGEGSAEGRPRASHGAELQGDKPVRHVPGAWGEGC